MNWCVLFFEIFICIELVMIYMVMTLQMIITHTSFNTLCYSSIPFTFKRYRFKHFDCMSVEELKQYPFIALVVTRLV